ncbi:hypothetical protein [Aeoliella sp. SH292]|uniref:hypothetical protein n=1 Tax=Aeoliella sp. SH292 TaxID=3454464 RepID=UPI003F9B9F3C
MQRIPHRPNRLLLRNFPMSYASKLSVALLVLALAPTGHVVAQFGGGLPENSVMVTTSVLVTGDTSAFPLDDGSLNALFTSSFIAEAGAKLKETLGEEVNLHRYPGPHFAYISGGRNGDSRVGSLVLMFVDPSEELQAKLASEAPKVVVDMLRQRVQKQLDKQVDQRARDLRTRHAALNERSATLTEEIYGFQKTLLAEDELVSSEELRKHYLYLDKRRREDRLTLLNIDAERQAVEKQIEVLRQQTDTGATTPLLEELKAAAASRHEALLRLRHNARAHSAKVEELEKQIEQLERTVQDEATKSTSDDSPSPGPSKTQQALEQLRDARNQLAHAQLPNQDILGSAEHAAMEGKIEYLRKKEELTQAQFGTQLQSLNGMLSQLAIQSDTAAARSEAIDIELESVAQSIRSASLIELQRKATDRQVQLLEAKLERVQQELIDVEMLLDKPQSQEFEVRLWGE